MKSYNVFYKERVRDMIKRISSIFLCAILVAGAFFSVPVNVKAASSGIERGRMQDTSSPDGGYIDWVYEYSGGKAKLTLSGNGYMPNGTDQDWFAVQQNAGCYIYEVVIKNGVKSLMENAFAGEIELKTITLPESIEFVGDSAFAYTPLKSLNIPKKMREITGSIFTGSSIKTFTVDSRNPYYKAHNGDIYSKDMTELVVAAPGKFTSTDYNFVIPQSVKKIGESAFYSTDVKKIKIPSNVAEVGKMAFAGCQNLSEVVVENGVRKFYDSVFLSCESLKEIHLPATVDYIGYCTFGYIYSVDLESLKQMLDDRGIGYLILTEYNFESYANLLGYSADAFMYCHPNSEFTLYAPGGSAGESYAKLFDVNYQKATVLTNVTQKSNGLLVKWNASSNILYNILYRKTEGSVWKEVGRFYEGQTSYLDEDISTNIEYFYSLKSVYMDGSENWDSSGMFLQCDLTSISIVGKGVSVNWKAKSNATGYNVYRKVKGETQWSYIDTVKNATSYIDKTAKNNKNYSYNVCAVKGNSLSAWSDKPLNITFVKTPNFNVSNTTDGIKVKWDSLSGADSYKVYRKTVGGSWKVLKTVAGNVSSYSDKNTVRGTTYQYAVRAVNNGYVSYFTTKTIKSIAAPMTVKLNNKTTGISVSWNKCAGASGYYVYRKNSSGSWSKIATLKSKDKRSYIDKNVKSGKVYTYRVKAYSGSYTSAYIQDGKKIRFLAPPKINSATSTKSGIKLSIGTVSGSKGYYVYRRESGRAWVKIATITSLKKPVFIDKSAKKGKTYIYTIKAYNGSTVSAYYDGKKVKDIY